MSKLYTLLIILITSSILSSQTIRVGAKHFNEGYILSEIISEMLENGGYKVERNFSLGGTLVCFDALRYHQIDIYPEYTGTISAEILKLDNDASISALNQKLKDEYKLEISDPYGFNNTYALTVTKQTSEKYNLRSISDLKQHPEIEID